MRISTVKKLGIIVLSVLISAVAAGTAVYAGSARTAAAVCAGSANESEWTSSESFNYSLNDDGSITITKFIGSETNVVIPERIEDHPVTEIGEKAFYSNRSLISVRLPEGLTSIGKSAFAQCYGLTSIDFPDSVVMIGESAFSTCSAIKQLRLPESLTVIEKEAFRSLHSVEEIEIPEGVTTIKDGAFAYSTGLKRVTVPQSVSVMGDGVFQYDYALETVVMPDDMTGMGKCVFEGCSSLKSVTIPSGIKTLSWGLFRGCEALEEIVIPQGVEAIDYGVFCQCGSLISVNIPAGVTSIDNDAFLMSGIRAFDVSESNMFLACAFRSFTVPESVTTIEKNAFDSCSELEVLVLPENLTEIGEYAFERCSSLEEVVFPDKLTRIGTGAFYRSGLKKANFGDVKRTYGTAVFSGCGFEALTIPETMNEVEDSMFYECLSLKSVEMADTVTKVGSRAFNGCKCLYTVSMPGVNEISEYAFSHCEALEDIDLSEITSIGQYAFSHSGLREVRISSPVTVPTGAFSNCSRLLSVNVGGNVRTLGNEVFRDCHFILSAQILPNVTGIGSDVFLACNKKLVIYGEENSSIQDYASKNKLRFVSGTNPPPINASTLGSDIISLGNSVTVNAEGYAGSGTLKYAVYYKQRSQSSWTRAQAYSENREVIITPKAATAYLIRVKLIDENGCVKNRDLSLIVEKATGNVSSISDRDITISKSLTVTCASSEGYGDCEFAVFYKQEKQTDWTCAQHYSYNKSVDITPKAATTYNVRVKMKTAEGRIINKDFLLTVHHKPTNTSTISSKTIISSQHLIIYMSGRDGTPPAKYAVYLKNPYDSVYVNERNYSTDPITTLRLYSTGTYQVRVKMQDKYGFISNKDFTITVK